MTNVAGQAAPPPPPDRPASREGAAGGQADGSEPFAALLAGALVPGGRTPPPESGSPGLRGGAVGGAESPGGDGSAGPDVEADPPGAAGGEAEDPRSLLLRAGGWSALGRGPTAEGTAAAGASAAEASATMDASDPAPAAEAGRGREDRTPEGATTGESAALAEAPASGVAGRGTPADPGLLPAAARGAVITPNRDPALLDPAFRGRLERVVERLESEHGIRARLLEGFRPQLRQEHLYGQGRTAPGPVVTWTLDSAHTRGRAADLKLEGGEENYRILHRIAGEEGLRTLGMKDPGHVELPRDGALPARGGAPHEASEPVPGWGAPPRGGVARVARVATVAAAASPGSPVPHRAPAPPGEAVRGGESSGEPRRPDPIPAPVVTVEGAGDPGGRSGAEAPAHAMTSASGGPAGSLRGAEVGTLPGTVAERVAGVEELRETMSSGPLRRVELRDADGEGTRIRIEVRGDTVRTEIRTADADLARRLQPAAAELEGALERHGLELGRLRVARVPEGLSPREVGLPASPNPGGGGGEEEGWRSGQERRHAGRDPEDSGGRQRPRPGEGGKEEKP